MENNGNLVFYDEYNKSIWQSFDHPTDTLLPGQYLSVRQSIISRASENDYSMGKYRLLMQQDGNLMVLPVDSKLPSITGPIEENVILSFEENGILSLRSGGDIIMNITKGGDPSENNIYRATIEWDGVFRVYSSRSENIDWHVMWESTGKGECGLVGLCGDNAYCSGKSGCQCLPGFAPVDDSAAWSSGCTRTLTTEDSKANGEAVTYSMLSLNQNSTWRYSQFGDDDSDGVLEQQTREECENACLNDSSCEAAFYGDNGECRKQKLPLRYGRLSEDPTILLIKTQLASSTISILFSPPPTASSALADVSSSTSLYYDIDPTQSTTSPSSSSASANASSSASANASSSASASANASSSASTTPSSSASANASSSASSSTTPSTTSTPSSQPSTTTSSPPSQLSAPSVSASPSQPSSTTPSPGFLAIIIIISIAASISIFLLGITCFLHFRRRAHNENTMDRKKLDQSPTSSEATPGYGTVGEVSDYKSAESSGTVFILESADIAVENFPRQFTHDQICQMTEDFKQEIGRGGYAIVYKGVIASTNGETLVVAVKHLNPSVTDERGFKDEIKVIGRIDHRNIVRLIGYCDEKLQKCLVYEFMPNGSLGSRLYHEENRLSWKERIQIVEDIVDGIHYLHEKCGFTIMHCDIKPDNILLDDQMRAKIADFGLVRLLYQDQSKTITSEKGTSGYIAPEWKGARFPVSCKVDVYSFGVLLLEIICHCKWNNVSYQEAPHADLKELVWKCYNERNFAPLKTDSDVDMESLEKLVKIGILCIQEDPKNRPSIKEVYDMLAGKTSYIDSLPYPNATPQLIFM